MNAVINFIFFLLEFFLYFVIEPVLQLSCVAIH